MGKSDLDVDKVRNCAWQAKTVPAPGERNGEDGRGSGDGPPSCLSLRKISSLANNE